MKCAEIDRTKPRAAATSIAAFGLVSGLSLAADRAAEAGVVYSGAQNISVNSLNPAYNLDVNGDSVADYMLAWSNTGFSADLIASAPGAGTSNGVVSAGANAVALIAGTAIDGSSTFSSGSQILGTTSSKDPVEIGGQFPNAGDRYLGLKFEIGGGSHFGWALVNDVAGDTGGLQSLTIKGWAYESIANKAINAGDTFSPTSAVPEPASLAQLAMGAAGLATLRSLRRRRAESVEAN